MDRKPLRDLKKGEYVVVSKGEYDGYSVSAICVVDRDIELESFLGAYIAARPEQAAHNHFSPSTFLAELVTRGYLKEINYAELHLSDYSDYQEVTVRD